MKYNKDNPLRVFEAFAGYSSQSLALQRLKQDNPEFDFVRVGWAEFDPQSKKPIDEQPAVVANKALFPDGSRNFGDITSIMWQDVPDFDLFTYSFPCQSISNAGRQAGLEKGSGTRSSLLWECERAIEIKRPKYLLMENVKALLSKKFKPYWAAWTEILEGYGYKTFTEILNAKDFGIPQNRERVFGVSILRTPDEPEPAYHFPKPFPLDACLADVLDEEVDEKYFLSDEMLARFCVKSVEQGDAKPSDTMPLGINGCRSNKLDNCKDCKFDLSAEQCARLYALMDKYGKTPLGKPYPR